MELNEMEKKLLFQVEEMCIRDRSCADWKGGIIMNRNRKKKNRKKETGAVVSLSLIHI